MEKSKDGNLVQPSPSVASSRPNSKDQHGPAVAGVQNPWPYDEVFSFPNNGWLTLQRGRTSCPEFTVQTMVGLFLDSVEQVGKSRKDYKRFVGDTKPIRLFKAGFVSRIKLKTVGDKVFFTAQFQQEMRS